MDSRRIAIVVPPAPAGMTPNREGASGLGALEAGAGGFRYPPHTAAQAAACLRAAGLEVTVLDAPALGWDEAETLARLRVESPRVVALQVSWATAEIDGAFCRALRVALPDAICVAMGSATHLVEPDVLGTDICLWGEPALALVDVCRRLLAGEALRGVVRASALPGHDAEGLIDDLDQLPPPAWDLLPSERYPFLSILSSCGCDHGCGWCPYVVAQGRRHRGRSPEGVVEEIAYLVAAYAPRRIVLRDPVFAQDRGRAEAICHGILQHPELRPGRNLRWECESRPDHLDTRLIRLMALAGCTGVKVGLETTDAELLMVHGRLDSAEGVAGYLARAAGLARECAALGVSYRVFAMVGLPGQTLDTVRETAGFVSALRPNSLSVKRFKRYPGIGCADGESPSDAEVMEQLALMERVIHSLADQPQRAPSRWSRALARRIYGLQAWLARRR